MSVTAWPFIEIDERGVPFIEGTTTKVTQIAVDEIAHRMTAEAIREQYPDLTLSQIHAALGYYHDHREECDRQIEEGRRIADEICRQYENPALLSKLRNAARK